LGFRVGGLGEQRGFEKWDAIEAPGGAGDFFEAVAQCVLRRKSLAGISARAGGVRRDGQIRNHFHGSNDPRLSELGSGYRLDELPN
jgi:hypothetical protein